MGAGQLDGEGAWDELCPFPPTSCHWAGTGDSDAEWSANTGAGGGWDHSGQRGLLPAVGGGHVPDGAGAGTELEPQQGERPPLGLLRPLTLSVTPEPLLLPNPDLGGRGDGRGELSSRTPYSGPTVQARVGLSQC